MTQPDIRINSDAVRRHAGMVDEFGTMIDEAAQAGGWVRASNDAYGLLYGSVFTGVLNPIQDGTIGAIRDAVTATQSLADLLRATAGDMDTSDDNAARRLGGH
ncbi:excreted virulence factor EspC (type VII ESX diderm) [Krasilnikovia cinnamomea]|uniref:Excreted virulence factor EspC (Type VII ESX diderm) n=1 Tax=Krasilnikovia cinnamomea TaxID=349313 RepID=A0A4Q7ZCT3_9ACTN|nr:type VII secretion target [Krasilnikovia cinnamomea]RZU48482.1 excreted virulence factor EspC (type VII ESX diderm) [Krasilnikovia cinnamomea]